MEEHLESSEQFIMDVFCDIRIRRINPDIMLPISAAKITRGMITPFLYNIISSSIPEDTTKCSSMSDNAKQYKKLFDYLLQHNETSVMEHRVYHGFATGFSRGFLLELERHRMLSLTVLSTRYTLNKLLNNITLFDKLFNNLAVKLQIYSNFKQHIEDSVKKEFLHTMYDEGHILDNLTYYLKCISDIIKTHSIPNDVLKYFMPELLPTAFIFTVNARSLLNMFELRSSVSAHFEFRYFMYLIWKILPQCDKEVLFNKFEQFARDFERFESNIIIM